MTYVEVNAQLSIEELLRAIGKLSQLELDQFMQRAMALRAQRQSPSLLRTEAELLQRINRALPREIQRRYDTLSEKRKAETLTPQEYEELLTLTNQVEAFEAQRVAYLGELAQLRQVSLSELLGQLKIRTLEYV